MRWIVDRCYPHVTQAFQSGKEKQVNEQKRNGNLKPWEERLPTKTEKDGKPKPVERWKEEEIYTKEIEEMYLLIKNMVKRKLTKTKDRFRTPFHT